MQIELVLLFFIIAFVYSSVGFGGGSSYLALLTLFGIDFLTLRVLALLCNITVVGGSVLIYWKKGLINWNKIAPLVAISIPAAFFGGYLSISEQTFFIVLGFTLLAASLLMFFQPAVSEKPRDKKQSILSNSTLGGSIGFLSGLVGIGGGIFLSPALHILKWDRALVISATASVYILANSIAGLLGQISHIELSTFNLPFILSLVVAVFIGGQLGVRIGIFKLNGRKLKRITAVLVFIVAIRILIKYLTI